MSLVQTPQFSNHPPPRGLRLHSSWALLLGRRLRAAHQGEDGGQEPQAVRARNGHDQEEHLRPCGTLCGDGAVDIGR